MRKLLMLKSEDLRRKSEDLREKSLKLKLVNDCLKERLDTFNNKYKHAC